MITYRMLSINGYSERGMINALIYDIKSFSKMLIKNKLFFYLCNNLV
jgi:hypothetical protein